MCSGSRAYSRCSLNVSRLRDGVVEELPVVAHQQQRARELGKLRLEQFERLDVEVVWSVRRAPAHWPGG